MAQRRTKPDINGGHIKAPLTKVVEANSLNEVWGDGKGEGYGSSKGGVHHFLSFAGVRSAYTTWSDIAMLFLMEMCGAVIITIAVGLASWYQGANGILNALMIAIAYSFGYYLATRLPSPDALPVHGNGALTVASMITRDIGLWGFFLYTAAQYIGMLVGGGLFLGLYFSGVTGGTGVTLPCLGITEPNTVAHSLVPIPGTVGALPSSLGTVIVLELLFGVAFVMIVIGKTYLYTATDDNASYAKSFRKGTKLGCVAIFVMVIIGYQVSVWTFSNVAWGGPAFGGLGWVPSCDLTRQTNQIVNLSNGIYANSVFTSGLAAMLYLLMPYADGIIGGFATILVLFIAFRKREPDTSGPQSEYFHDKIEQQPSPSPLNIAASTGSAALRSMLLDPQTGRPL